MAAQCKGVPPSNSTAWMTAGSFFRKSSTLAMSPFDAAVWMLFGLTSMRQLMRITLSTTTNGVMMSLGDLLAGAGCASDAAAAAGAGIVSEALHFGHGTVSPAPESSTTSDCPQ